VLYEREGELIAQFKFTALILPAETVKLSAAFPLPHVTSQYDVATVPLIGQTLALPLTGTYQKPVETTEKMEIV